MFKLNLETLELGYTPDAMDSRGYAIIEYCKLENLGVRMLLALTDGNDDALETLADLLASACPTPTDLGQLAQDTERLSQKLWQRYDAAGGESEMYLEELQVIKSQITVATMALSFILRALDDDEMDSYYHLEGAVKTLLSGEGDLGYAIKRMKEKSKQ